MITIDVIQKRIIEAIKNSGLQQVQIAKELRVSKQTVSHYVNGDKLPALDTFANLCKVLDLDANEILGIID
ncbi:MAG: helix-turn-helix domain-containing protein [Clostridia bacterium]|nr:helix-turn-helix domain-containing protein [Clostridia bacterium]